MPWKSRTIADASSLHSACLSFCSRRELAREILFHHQSADRHTEVGTPSAVFNIYGDSDFRFVHWCEAHEHRVVATVVLRRTRLAARLERQASQRSTRALQCRRTHTRDNVVVRTARRLGIMLVGVSCVERFALHLAHDMRTVVVAAVGDGSAEVGNLQRSERHLALTDRDRDDGESVPRAAIVAVVVVGVRNHAALLARKVDAQFVAEAHRHHIVAPYIHGVVWILVFGAVAYHVVESPAEVGVARSADGVDKSDRSGVGVAADMQTAIVETAVARECGAWSDNAFGHVRQSLRRLERRPRRIHTHYRTVEERFPSVFGKSAVILGACAANHDAWVVGWRRHHAEHFARARVESHDRTYLTFHKAFAQSLQFLVDGERKVFSGNRLAVVFALHILPLDASASIAQQYLHALLAAQLFLVRLLHAEFADVVARLVVAVFLNVVGRNLRNVAEYVRTYRRLILAYAALLHVEAREAENLLMKVAELLRRKLTHEHLLREARVAWVLRVVFDVVHALYEILFRDAQSAAELKRVDASLRLVHHHHDVVRRLVVHEQTSVAVVDGSTRRIFNLLEKGV